MLKQILATTAVLSIVALSVQSANAASGQFRQLVVEPAGGSAGDLLLKNKKVKPQFLVSPGNGIATPPSLPTAGKTGGAPIANFIVAPGGGLPTPPSGNAGIGKNQLVVAQGSGIPSQAGAGGGFQPLLLKTSGGVPTLPSGNGGIGKSQLVVAGGSGIPSQAGGAGNGGGFQPGGIPTQVASADPGKVSEAAAAFPAIANPSAITTPAVTDGTDVGGGAGADATPAAGPGAPPQPVDAVVPAVNGSDNGGAGSEAPAAAAPASPAPAVQTPMNLYSVLIAHGYGVEILKSDPNGNLVFYVTAPGSPKEADLLLVDAQYGKVLERRHIAAYSYNYGRPPAYAPGYASTDASYDNCDQSGGY